MGRMCDPESLIASVERHPCIWDVDHEDYHNRLVKGLAWEQVCQEVINNWEMCKDKTSMCNDLKKRWTNIRDYYRKELKNISSDNAAKKQKKYVFDELLSFLKPVFNKKISRAQHEDSESVQSEQQYIDEESIKQEDDEQELPKSPLRPTPVQKRTKDASTQVSISSQPRQETKPNSSYVMEDDDTKFLLSFRSDMRKMNTTQRVDFKLGMLQLLKKNMSDNYPSSSNTQ